MKDYVFTYFSGGIQGKSSVYQFHNIKEAKWYAKYIYRNFCQFSSLDKIEINIKGHYKTYKVLP